MKLSSGRRPSPVLIILRAVSVSAKRRAWPPPNGAEVTNNGNGGAIFVFANTHILERKLLLSTWHAVYKGRQGERDRERDK